ncbi:hypothetical protein Tco_0766300, partial [Tanacetum coccineum]
IVDELCEEIVVNSSGIEKYSDYVMNLYDNGKETESRVSAMGDENTIGEQDGKTFHNPMEFFGLKMDESGYTKMTICDLNKLDDGVNGSFAIMGVFSKCNFEGLLPAKQVILLDRKMMGNGDKRVVYGFAK